MTRKETAPFLSFVISSFVISSAPQPPPPSHPPLPHAENEAVCEETEDDDDDHDRDDLTHVVELASHHEEISEAGKGVEELAGHEGAPGERPA